MVEAQSRRRKYCSKKCSQLHRRHEIRAYLAEYHQKHRDKKNARSLQFRQDNAEEYRQYQVEYYLKNRENKLLADKERRFGISRQEYLERLAARNGLCEICGEPQKPRSSGLVPVLAGDHDHETGRFRGFLCSSCNTALGGFRDSVEIMSKAIAYIQRTSRVAPS